MADPFMGSVMAKNVQRRLAAILAADVVGYSRLMEANEETTLATLDTYRRFIDERIAEHRGRVFGSAGDSVIAEFVSPVEAVCCAVEIQHELESRNTELAADRRMQFRVGINLGDVVVEGENLHGDGVNIAARLEELAEPGGICVSGTAYDHLMGKLNLRLDDLGEQRLKNISRPVRVWRWIEGKPITAGPARSDELLPLADKPAIAVLSFTNMSGDPEQEYFADGIAEDIITGLCRFRNFLVIARNTTFTYKGQAVDISQVSRDLKARYVVEGSVRKSANRIRVTAQLIDGNSGAHIWAERYDGVLEDIFDLQDEITTSIVSAVAPQSLHAEVQRASGRHEADLGTWDLLMKARWHMGRYNRKDGAEALRLLRAVVDRDRQNAQAYGWLAMMHGARTWYGWTGDPSDAIAEATDAARQAVSLDAMDAMAHAVTGLMMVWGGRFENAIASCRHAVHLNPNLAVGHGLLAAVLGISGRYEEAVSSLQIARRLSPLDPELPFFRTGVGLGALSAGRYEDVLQMAEEVITARPDFPAPFRQKAAAYASLNRPDEARRELERLRNLMPNLTLQNVRLYVPLPPKLLEQHVEALRKAGLPE